MAARKPHRSVRKRGDSGRPPKLLLQPEIERRMVQALKLGVYRETAAIYAGLLKQTFHDYCAKGHEDRQTKTASIYTRFLDLIEQAEADAEVAAMATVRSAKPNWQANAWFLERKMPDRYGRLDRIRVEDQFGKPREPRAVLYGPDEAKDAEAWAAQNRPSRDPDAG